MEMEKGTRLDWLMRDEEGSQQSGLKVVVLSGGKQRTTTSDAEQSSCDGLEVVVVMEEIDELLLLVQKGEWRAVLLSMAILASYICLELLVTLSLIGCEQEEY
jgi:hypothetical protein